MASDSVAESAFDTSGEEADACGALDSAHVYVDVATTKPGIGTATCPFPDIQAALAVPLVAPTIDAGAGGAGILRTVHVAAGNYVESGKVSIPAFVALVGAGASTTKIVASGACIGGEACAVELAEAHQRSRLEGFTITGAHTGVVTVAMTTSLISVSSVSVTGVVDGIHALGAVTLDHVELHANSGWGVRARGSVVMTSSQISTHAIGGVLVDGAGSLSASDTSIESNGTGVVIAANGGASFDGCRIQKNGSSAAPSNGITVGPEGSLRLRNTSLLGNTHNGLAIAFGPPSDAGAPARTLDLGTGSSPGKNVLSSATTSLRNAHAALCFESVASGTAFAGMVSVEGNSWSACSSTTPTVAETAISGDCASVTTQLEIAYQSPNIEPRVARITPGSGCSVAP
ncbi:MAG: right-handed parallel beta-helix repeat-containing protein [Polyangiales bacterium]